MTTTALTDRISLRLTSDELARLYERAEAERRSLSQTIRLLLERSLNDQS